MATIQGVYLALFGRPADPTGLSYFNSVTNNGANLSAIGNLATQAEYTSRFTGMSNVQIINSIYQSLFGRDADATGLTFFANQLASGRQTINTIAINILDGATGSDLTTVNNKIAAANLFTASLDTGPEIVAYSGTAAADAGRAFIAGVTATVPTQAAVDLAVANIVNNPAPTNNISLTTNADVLNGTINADAFAASVVFDNNEAITTASTLTVADQITGGAGTDILNITVSGAQDAGVTLPAATVSGVEIFNIRNTVGQTASIDASNFAGVTAVNSDRSVGAVTVTNLASGASAGLIGDGVVTNGALNAGYATAATASTVNISGGTKAGAVTVTGGGITSATINSTGAANTIGAYAGAASTTSTTINAATALTTGAVTNAGATLTITGAGAVNLSTTALEAGVTKVDASANTGGVTVALGTAVTQTVTGGSGNDVITSGAILTTGSVNAGAGTDTLVLGNVNHANTAALAAKYTNFETLRVNGTFDASLIAGISAIELSGATNNISKLSAAQAASVTALADIGATTLALAVDTGTTDVVNLTLGNGNGAAFDTGALTINGVETLNIRANAKAGNADQTSTIASFTADKLTTINLTGSAVTLTNAAVASAVTINGSALTGTGGTSPTGLTVSGNLVKGSVVTGSAVADTLTTTAAIAGTTGDFVTYNGGAGNDTISSTVAAINNTSAANGSLKIDGGAGTDTLTLTDAGGLTLVDANFQNVTNVETIGYAVANQAISITSGGFFDTNFKTAGVTLNLGDATNANVNTVNLQSFTGNATVSLTATAATTQAQTIITGSGNDTVTLLAAGTTSGAHSISTGAGSDTINVTINGTDVTTGAVTINAGAAQDTINITGNSTANADTASNVVIRVNEGHSALTAFDSVSGFVLNTASKVATSVDFDGTAAVAANVTTATAAAGFTNVTYTISNGLLSFAGTGASALTAAQKATIAQNVVTAADATVVFTDGSDSYVFHNGVTTDDLVKLVGVSAAGAEATVGNANFVLIA